MTAADAALRDAVRLVAVLNLVYFGVEFAMAASIGSVSLFADSVDFIEDAAVNFLIVAALGWSASLRAKVGVALAAILLVPALAFLWMLWRKVSAPLPPQAMPLSITGAGALIVNLFCAFSLARWRRGAGSLAKAAFLSARNDAIANIAIIGAGAVTARWSSVWPDVVVGLGIAAMNVDAARAVLIAARDERRAIESQP